MKKFIVFSGDIYYPIGGASDLHSSFDTLEKAMVVAEKEGGRYQWSQVVDSESFEILFEFQDGKQIK